MAISSTTLFKFHSALTVLACMCRTGAAYMKPGSWMLAHATFYGDDTAQATMGGSCGYGDLWQSGYGVQTAAVSTVLYNNGNACGQCFQIRCTGSKWCYKGSPITTITVTNLCPPNWAEPSDNGGWCNPPRQHFDMAKPAFEKVAVWQAGIIPVVYRRVACPVRGGIKFKFDGNAWWLLAYVINVGGSGDVASMWVKGTSTGWLSMSHNWGASYQVFQSLQGQALSFKIVSYTTHETLVAYNVAPANWQFGNTYQSSVNFH